ncbi:MAG: hypothetical protein ACR2PT_20405 [Endozoicomonas sp.]
MLPDSGNSAPFNPQQLLEAINNHKVTRPGENPGGIRIGLNENNQPEFQPVASSAQWSSGAHGQVKVDPFKVSENRLIQALNGACIEKQLKHRTIERNEQGMLTLANEAIEANLKRLAGLQSTVSGRSSKAPADRPRRDFQKTLHELNENIQAIRFNACSEQLQSQTSYKEVVSTVETCDDAEELEQLAKKIYEMMSHRGYLTPQMNAAHKRIQNIIRAKRRELRLAHWQEPARKVYIPQLNEPVGQTPKARETARELLTGLCTKITSDKAHAEFISTLEKACQHMQRATSLQGLSEVARELQETIEREAGKPGFNQRLYEGFVKEILAQVQKFCQERLSCQVKMQVKALSEELVCTYQNGCCPDKLSARALVDYSQALLHSLDEKNKGLFLSTVQWLAAIGNNPQSDYLPPPPEVQAFLEIDLQSLANEGLRVACIYCADPMALYGVVDSQAPVCQLALSLPEAEGVPVRYQEEPAAIVEIRENFSDPKVGLPVRRAKGSSYIDYFFDVDLRERQGGATGGMDQYRPVTYLMKGARLRVYCDDGVVLGFDPGKVKPWAIYKKNALTNKLMGKSQKEVEALADSRAQRENTKRLCDIEALGEKMLEHAERRGSLDRQVTSGSHFDVKKRQWTQPRIKMKDNSFFPEPHNEVVVQGIQPNMIACNVHSLDPWLFEQGRRSSFYALAETLGRHREVESYIKHYCKEDRKIPVVVHAPFFGSIIETGYFEDMVPEELQGKGVELEQVLKKHSVELLQNCEKNNVNHVMFQQLMVRAPMKAQLDFLTKHSSFPGGVAATLDALWAMLSPSELKLTAPDDVAVTTQELLNRLVYSPRSRKEADHCLKQGMSPNRLAGRTAPQEVVRCAMNSEWFCQLLETEGVDFSRQEKLALCYASLLRNCADSPQDAARLLQSCFSQYLDPGLVKAVAGALQSIDEHHLDPNPRIQLYQHVLRFSCRLDSLVSGTSRQKVTDEYLSSPDTMRALSVPEELLAKPEFVERLLEAIHGSIDLMEVTGNGRFEDQRPRQAVTDRFGLAPLTQELNKARAEKMIRSANVWQAMHETLTENCKRQVCALAERPVSHTPNLKAFNLPNTLTTLDLLSINSESMTASMAPLVDHIREHGLARPTGNLEKKEQNRVDNDPALKRLMDEERNKAPGLRVLGQIKSPSQELYSEKLLSKLEFFVSQPHPGQGSAPEEKVLGGALRKRRGTASGKGHD